VYVTLYTALPQNSFILCTEPSIIVTVGSLLHVLEVAATLGSAARRAAAADLIRKLGLQQALCHFIGHVSSNQQALLGLLAG
jgi:ABC-type uncharacterized transport system YnjBCD ATPase subunit